MKSRWILLGIVIVVFVAFKIPFLHLPYYWDEAWVYAPAISTMESTGLSILPSALPPELSRGHPLLFHFLGALWMKIFGTTVLVSHIFSLVIAVLLLVAVFLFGKRILNSSSVGLLAVVALCLQPVFLAQSGLLLPEGLLTLLLLLAFYFYFRQKDVLYIVASTLALLTKESGVVAIVALLIWNFIETWFVKKERDIKPFLRRTLVIGFPLIPFLAFLISQYLLRGWFFFPEHINYISFSADEFFNKLDRYAGYVFIYQGRNLLTFTVLIGLIVLLFRKQKMKSEEIRSLLALLFFTLVFLLFSAVNFYSDRYMMPVIPILTLVFAFIIVKTFNFKWMVPATIVVSVLLQWPQIRKRSNSDHNLGYANAVEVHEKAIQYCEEQNLQHKNLYAGFLMERYMENAYAGYVKEENKFYNVSSRFSEETEYALFSNVEDRENYETMKSNGRLHLLKTFSIDPTWIELYKIER